MMNEDPTILSIGKARKCFNDELHSKAYALVHADNEQLQGLLSFLAPKNEQVFLDLGTGNGYVGMSLAGAVPWMFGDRSGHCREGASAKCR